MTQEDIERYKRKSGDNQIGGQFCLEEEGKGFVTYDLKSSDALVIHCVYGDGRYWVSRCNDIAKQAGKRKMLAGTGKHRRPEVIKRRLGFDMIGYLYEKAVE